MRPSLRAASRPALRRAATLVAFVHTLEASAQDDAVEVLDLLLHEIFGDAEKADRKARLRSLKDLDAVAMTLAQDCTPLLDASLPDDELRGHVFARVPRETLAGALRELGTLVRPPEDMFYTELQTPDHDRHRGLLGCGVRPIPLARLPLQSAARRHRRYPLLAHRPPCRLRHVVFLRVQGFVIDAADGNLSIP
jgi:hypothetical protein